MLKKLLFFMVLFLLSISTINFSSAQILPIKKPELSTEETQKKLLVDVLKPLPKPIKKKEIEEKKEIIVKKVKEQSGLLLPKKKPIIAGSVDVKNIKESKYFSKKDFKLAKKAISEMKLAKWPNAIQTAKKAKDRSIYDFIQWRHLLTKGNKASYYDYKNFIDRNDDYPRIGRIKYLSEHKLSTDTVSPKKIVQWYGEREPLSGFGKMILGESYIFTGNKEKGIKLIKNGWVNEMHTNVPGPDGQLSYGGACFPKDTQALYHSMLENGSICEVLGATISERNKMRKNENT